MPNNRNGMTPVKWPVVSYVDENKNRTAISGLPTTNASAGSQYAAIAQSLPSAYYATKANNDDTGKTQIADMVAVPYRSTTPQNTAGNNAATPRGSGGGTRTYTVNAGNQPYVDQLNSLYDQIMNRKPFQYDLNGDLLYRQMADRYTQLGQQAMRDTMGQAAALTGGYGNSYANQVGNQAYQQYLTALNDNIPQLWDRAYQVYQDQGDQLMQQYQLAAAHPEYVNALAPRTYSVSVPAEEEEAETSSGSLFDKVFDRAKYAATLMKAGLADAVAGAGSMQVVTNPFAYLPYEFLEDDKKK